MNPHFYQEKLFDLLEEIPDGRLTQWEKNFRQSMRSHRPTRAMISYRQQRCTLNIISRRHPSFHGMGPNIVDKWICRDVEKQTS